MSNEIRHGATSHNIPITVLENGVRVNSTDGVSAPVLPTVLDIIGEDGASLGAGPNFGLQAAPVVSQDTASGGGDITGAYRITFQGRAANGGVFRGGESYRILWEAQIEGAAYQDEAFLTVELPTIELSSPS